MTVSEEKRPQTYLYSRGYTIGVWDIKRFLSSPEKTLFSVHFSYVHTPYAVSAESLRCVYLGYIQHQGYHYCYWWCVIHGLRSPVRSWCTVSKSTLKGILPLHQAVVAFARALRTGRGFEPPPQHRLCQHLPSRKRKNHNIFGKFNSITSFFPFGLRSISQI